MTRPATPPTTPRQTHNVPPTSVDMTALDAAIPIPGTPIYAHGLSDWLYGNAPPATPAERQLWRDCFETHLGQLPPEQRPAVRRLFRPASYPQSTIGQQATLFGVLGALAVMQLAPRLIGNADSALALPLALALVGGFVTLYGVREYLWGAWAAQFQALGLTPPARVKVGASNRAAKKRVRKGKKA